MMGASYEIDPPTPNPLLKKYEVNLFADAIYSNYIWMIVGSTKNLSAKDCQKNMHIFIDHYQENKKAKFIAAMDKIGMVWNMKIEVRMAKVTH